MTLHEKVRSERIKDWALMERHEFVTQKINGAFPDAIEEIYDFRGERTLFIKKNQIKAICQFLCDDEDLQYNFISDICADDLLPQFPRFAVNYHLYSIP